MNADLLSLSPRELLSREETYTALSEADQSYLTADGLQHYVATHLPHLLHVAQQLPVELTDLTAIALTLLCGRGKDVEGDDDVRVEMDQWRPTINALTALGGYAEAIFSADVATLGVVLLARRSCVVPRVARLINRILLASLMMSYEETLKVMMMAISTEWMREVVRNLAKSNIISYTILTILDWAPSLHLFPDANTTTAHASENTVCGVWLANQFPHYVLEYLPMALNAREDADHTFFTFVREVIQGGLSPLRGPIADALLKNHQFSQMVEAVVVRCETDMRELSCTSCSHAPFMHSCAHVSMAEEGITLMVQSLHLLRSSLEGASTMEKYTSQIHASPISSLLPAMPRMVRVLHMEPIQEPMLSIRGPPKHVLCDVFLEVALLQRACTDTALVQSGFFGALFFLCERYPNREPLLHRLSKLVMHLFTRTLLMDAPMEVWMEQDVLLSAFLRPMTCNDGATNEGVTAATPAGPTSKLAAPTSSSSSSMSCLHRLIHYSISASYERHTLSTFSMALLYHLSASCPLFAQDGPLYHELEPFRRCARVRERLSCMNDELTGRHHHEKGSSCAAMAHHSPEINYATKRERIHQRQKSPILTLERFDEMEDVGSSGSTFFRAPPRTVVEEPMLDVAAMIDEQVALRSRGSPQVQAYPNFGTMSLGFSSGP